MSKPLDALTNEDFRVITRLIGTLPTFRLPERRYTMLEASLMGSPYKDKIISQADLSGAPSDAAVSLVLTLKQFGTAYKDRPAEALGIFLNYVLDSLPETDQNAVKIQGLFNEYEMGVSVARPSLTLVNWRGDETPKSVQEKAIGEDTLRDIRMLELALEAAQAVVLIQVNVDKGWTGTGFLVAPNLIMTNCHVLSTLEEARKAFFVFHQQLDRVGKPMPTYATQMVPGGLFYKRPAPLDFALVEVDAIPAGIRPLSIKREIPEKDQRVAIIQHPGGNYKKISMQNNHVQYADKNVIHYTTTTNKGSSGAPVFNENFEVIGIHHSGGDLIEPTTQITYERNGGSTMEAVLADLRANQPDLFNLLSASIS